MLEMGAIQESQSPWSSNCVIVRKKDGTIRFCIDFRKLNANTKKESYAIPKVEDTLHLLAGSRYFSKLDLKCGYWQVELEEEDKEKTAFQVGGLGFYQCNRLPFGLCNAPATFQRLMERCMGDLNLRDCLIYLDDIIIFSKDVNTMIARLDQVFCRLAEYNLKIKPSKCEFFKTRTTYLGHVVSADGIEADPVKIEAVKYWPTPKSVKQVRQFLGFVGYYRRFIKGFASIARPLNNLLIGHPTKRTTQRNNKAIKPVLFQWGSDQQTAFEELKKQLTNPPILGYADYTLPFILHTDASSKGLGAVLYQRQDGHEKVIAYASRSLKPSEKHYPAHKLEFLALKWSMTEKFHDYLYGAEVEVITDNNPLTYVLTSAKLDATGQRWLAALSNYTFTTRYRAGKNNADADGLSRVVVQQETIAAITTAVTAGIEQAPYCFSTSAPVKDKPEACDQVPEDVLQTYALSSHNWRKSQLADPVISKVIHKLQAGTRPSVSSSSDSCTGVLKYSRHWPSLELKDGVLYRRTKICEQEYSQLVLPEALREIVFSSLHDDLGHQGRDRTLSLFKQRFFWPGMERFVKDKISNCARCIRSKTPAEISSLVNITTSSPMELVCIDFLSLEKSKGGYEHILVITDHFTRYAQAFPTTNQTARTTAKVLFEKFFVHYGFPARLHSDQGTNFMSGLISELCKLAGIEQSRTTPYHPMGNGMTERFNQTLLHMLSTLEEDKKSDWKSYVAPMVHAYNSTIHTSAGYSPYYLMFGRHPRLAIDALLDLPSNDNGTVFQNEYSRKLRDRLATAYSRAKENAFQNAEKSKRVYDTKARATKIIPGDLVLVRNVTQRGKQKIADKWEDVPYVVIDQPNTEIPVYDVKKDQPHSKCIRRVHRNLLLPLGITEQHQNKEQKAPRYVIPQRRTQSRDNNDDGSVTIRRSNRQRKAPNFYVAGSCYI